MPRNIVICCDGTSNEFGPTVTNVVRLVQVSTRDPLQQEIHYLPGVGTMPGPGFVTRLGQKISLIMGLGFGAGLTDIVESAYCYLMNVWEPGDKVFIFGFSRGSYTARVLAAMLHAFGLLPRGSDDLVPYAMRLFRSVRSQPSKAEEEADSNYWKLLNQFRGTFARTLSPASENDSRRFPVHFLGVWDTVSSIGWVWEPATFPYTRTNPSVAIVRHALSIDERRWFFRQNEFKAGVNQDCQEIWFAGSHGDVGGGYLPNQGQIWWNSLEWMLDEAKQKGLLINDSQIDSLRKQMPPTPALEPQHESLTAKWWPLEFVPKWEWQHETGRKILRMGLGRRRTLPKEAVLHQSVFLRKQQMQPPYRPPNAP